MKTFRQTFLELYAKTHPEKPYSKDLLRYRQNGQDQRLPYHNSVHVSAVLRLAATMRKMDSELPRGPIARAMDLAVAYHDFNHTGKNDAYRDGDGKTNILRALDGLMSSTHVQLLPAELIETASLLLTYTAYPHEGVPTDPQVARVVNLLRDADMLWGLLPDHHRDCLVGVGVEFADPRPEDPTEMDWATIVDKQIAFIEAFQPYSSIGRGFKSAFLAEAIASWKAFPEDLTKLVVDTKAAMVKRQTEVDEASEFAMHLAMRRRIAASRSL